MNCDALTEATYEIKVLDRYTGRPVPGCTFDQGDIEADFNRTLDGISGASLIQRISSADCVNGQLPECDCDIIERRHELAFFRSDRPSEPAWVGPITRRVDDPFQGTIRIVADDRLYWWEGAVALRNLINQLPNEINGREIVLQLFELAEEYADPGAGLDFWYEGVNGQLPPDFQVFVESKLKAGESVWGAIAGYAKSILDFTVVGPHLYWGVPEIPIKDGPKLTPDMWAAPPVIDRDAGGVATQVIVVGAGGVTGIYPAKDVDRGFGKRAIFVSDTNLNSQLEADTLAKAIYEQNETASDFIITGEGSLSANFPLSLHELIPGRIFPVCATGQCLETEDVLRLFNVVVQIGTVANPSRCLVEKAVKADFQRPGSEGKAERQSG